MGISQNELIEQAIEHEVVARGAMLSDDLRAAADRLAELTEEQYERIQARGVESFIAGEGLSEPLQSRLAACCATRQRCGGTFFGRPRRYSDIPIGARRAGMTAPSWHEDDPKNLSLIQSNAEQLLTELRATAAERILPTPEELPLACTAVRRLRRTGRRLSRAYAGTPLSWSSSITRSASGRGSKTAIWKDGRLGAQSWQRDERRACRPSRVFAELDARLPVGKPPRQPTRYSKSSALPRSPTANSSAYTFANGNGRIARLLVAFICLRAGCRCSCMSSRGRKRRLHPSQP